MSSWVVIGSSPQRGFYPGPARPSTTLPDLSYPTLSGLGRLRRPLEISGGEAANVNIEIGNGDGALTNIAADWLFEPATVYFIDGSTESIAIAGTIQSVEISDHIEVSIVG